MALKTTEIRNTDPNLQPSYWLNEDVRQSHFFVSILNRYYPDAPRQYLKIEAKPGMMTLIPHRYYVISSRDGTPCRGKWLYSRAVEEGSENSLSRGDALGHESKKKIYLPSGNLPGKNRR